MLSFGDFLPAMRNITRRRIGSCIRVCVSYAIVRLCACARAWFLNAIFSSSDVFCRYPNLIKYSITESKQLVVDNAFVVKATLETEGDPVVVAPRHVFFLILLSNWRSMRCMRVPPPCAGAPVSRTRARASVM